MTLVALVRLLLSRWKILCSGPILAAGIALLFAQNQPPEYQTRALVQLDIVARSSAAALPGESTRFDRYAVQSTISNLLTLLASRSVAASAGEMLLTQQIVALREERMLVLPDGTEAANPLPGQLAGFAGEDAASLQAALLALPITAGRPLPSVIDDPLAASFLDWALNERPSPWSAASITDNLSVRQQGDGDIIELTFVDPDPVMAALLLSQVIERFARLHFASQGESFNTARAFFEEQVRAAQQHLSERETTLKAFMIEHGISNYIDQTRALAQHIETAGLGIEQAAQQEAAARAEMDAIEQILGGEAALLVAVTAEHDSALLARETEVAEQKAAQWLQGALSGQQTPPAPLEAETLLQDRLREHFSQRQLGLGIHRADLVAAWAAHRVEHQGAKAGREALEVYRDQMHLENERYARLGSEVGRLEREIDVAERAYLELLDSLNTARLYERQLKTSEVFQILDPVGTPRKPQPTRLLITLALAAIITGTLQVSALLLIVYFDRSLQTLSDFEQATGLAVLGGLPTIKSAEARPSEADLNQETILGRLLAMPISHLRNLMSSTPLVIQVIGLQPGGGKSTAAAFLAAGLAHRGISTLLLKEPGGLHDIIHRGEHDCIILDTPDLTQHSSALEHADVVSASVLLLCSGASWREADQRFLDALAQAGAPVLGVLINHLNYAAAEGLLGHVSRPRSTLRRAIRRLLAGNLRGQSRWVPADEPS